MKTEHLNSPEVRKVFLRHTEHELTICRGDNAFGNLKASLALARALLESRRFDSVVYVNLPFSKRRFTDARRDVFPKSENNQAFIVIHNQIGRLGPEFWEVEDSVKKAKGKVAVIVNSWELASSSYRYKEQLLFALHGLVCCNEITVFVYTQAKEGSIEPGVIHRAGLGRLAAFAVAVMELPEEQSEDDRGASVPLAIPGPPKPLDAGRMPALQSAQLHGSKIKELGYADLRKGEEMAVAV